MARSAFSAYRSALYHHFKILVTGVVGFMVSVAQFLYRAFAGKEAEGAWTWLMLASVGCILWASYRAWRDEYQRANGLERLNNTVRPLITIEFDGNMRQDLSLEPILVANVGSRDAVNVIFDPIRLDDRTVCTLDDVLSIGVGAGPLHMRESVEQYHEDGGLILEPSRMTRLVAKELQKNFRTVTAKRWPVRVEYSDYIGHRFFTLCELEGLLPSGRIRIKFVRSERIH